MLERQKQVYMCNHSGCSRIEEDLRQFCRHQREAHRSHEPPEKLTITIFMCNTCKRHFGTSEKCKRHELDQHPRTLKVSVVKKPLPFSVINEMVSTPPSNFKKSWGMEYDSQTEFSECSSDDDSDQGSSSMPVKKKSRLTDTLANCDKTMFKGMIFVLTVSARKGQKIEINPRFVKRDVTFSIKQLGGEVIDGWESSNPVLGRALLEGRAYCISDTYYRTAKYLTSLAAGAILISHKWILDSAAQGKLLPEFDYLLPAGADYISGNGVVKQTIQPQFTRRVSPFGNARIIIDNGRELVDRSSPTYKGPVFCGERNLYSIWKPIFEETGGDHIMETVEEKDTCTAQVYAVVDENTKRHFFESCGLHDIPLVTTEWIVACLVHNKLIDPKSKPLFTFTQNTE